MTTLTRRLAGLLATLGLLVFAAGIPIALALFGLDPLDILKHPIWSNLLAPDDGTMAWVGTGIIVWAIWSVLVYCLLLELVATVRGIHAPEIRGLTLPQSAARTLVTWASMLFVAVPAATAAIPIPSGHAASGGAVPAIATSAPLRSDQVRAPVVPPRAVALAGPALAPVTSRTAPAASLPARVPGTVPYEVRRGDSLWRIAEKVLGDPLRYTEIAALNAELLGGTPDFIAPPMVLLLPSNAEVSTPTDDTYVVKPGDTLSQLAKDNLGDASRYPEIVDASKGIVQPGGETLTDPDRIKAGWGLDLTVDDDVADVARTTASRPATPPAHEPAPSDTSERATPAPAAVAPAGSPSPSAVAQNGDAAVSHDVETADDTQRSTSGWLLPGLSGAGALLAGSLLLTVRAHRRTQLRHRKPGQMLQPLPHDLLAVDRTAEASGAPTASQIQTLDALLRELSRTYPNPQHYPPILTVELSEARVIVHLAEDATLPTPWAGEGRGWSAPVDEHAPATGVPPYPLLVTVGRSTDGHVWLLNLEQVGSLAVTGARAQAFGRYLAAELALNPWSVLVSVHAVGFGHELALIDPLRFTHHTDDDPDALDEITRAVDPSGGVLNFDPEAFHVLLAASARAGSTDVRDIVNAISTHPTRSGAAVVVIAARAHNGDVEVTTTVDGRLTIPSLGLDLDGVGLTAEEARDCALLTSTTDDAPCVAYPVDETAFEGIDAYIDAAGALRPHLVNDRPDDLSEPAGATSLLPLPTEQYVEATPTTAQDVQTLAPAVPDETRKKIVAAYPGLDDDVAEWAKGSDCAKPRLALLGPVTAHGRGDPHAAAKRRPFLTGLLGYLALHPNGVTSDEVKTIAGGAENYRNNIKDLRRWMGKSPLTGQDYVPYADRTRAAKANGEARYQVDDVLVDWELFKGLRARGAARGVDHGGIADLELALTLVTGVPFSQRHTETWKWLDESERLDLIAPCAIVDVAHTVVVHALTVGNLPMARRAVDVAILAAPDDETARLDLIDILHAEGHSALARTKLHEGIVNRSDDHHAPISLPERTADILTKPNRARPGTRGPS